MKMTLPRKRVILAIHRWLGAAAAVFLLTLAVTGLCLNHSERLGLGNRHVRIPFILEQYNMSTGSDIRSLKIDDSKVLSVLDKSLFFGSDYVSETGNLVGLYHGQQFVVVIAEGGLVFLSDEGELIEELGIEQLPFSDLRVLGSDNLGNPILVADNGNWSPDPDWIEFVPFEGEYSVDPLAWTELDETSQEAILEANQGKGPSVYRVLLDLHSGRLFGWGGRTVMDLTAISIILLVSTGISGWLRKPRRNWVVR